MELSKEVKELHASRIKFSHRPGGHCASVAWSGIFRHAGFDYDEADIFGLGSGMFFGYVAVPKIKRFNIPLCSPTLVNNIVTNTGIYGKLYQISDNVRAFNEIVKSIESGKPVAVELNPEYCSALSSLGALREHLPLHWVVVTGVDFDRGVVTTYDNCQFNPIEIAIDEFMEARNSGERWTKNPKNCLYSIAFPKQLFPFEVSFKLALTATLYTFSAIEKYNSVYVGDYGYQKIIRQMPLWNVMMQPDLLISTLYRLKMTITGAGGVKGGYRMLYAHFLEKAATRLNKDHLMEVAAHFRESAIYWGDFAALLDEAIQTPTHPEFWKEKSLFGELLAKIYAKEKAAFSLLEKVVDDL